MNWKFFIVFCLAFFSFEKTYAQGHFVENKGQYSKSVSFKLSTPMHQIYFENNRFLFNLIDGTDFYNASAHHGVKGNGIPPSKIQAHAYEMSFKNANPLVKIIGNEASSHYENYLVGNRKQWARNVKRYSQLIYQDLYPNIDLKIEQNPKGIKYDFLVKPEASLEDIKIQYNAIDDIKLKNGQLLIATSVEEITEQAPYVYQIIQGRTVEIRSEYVLNENTLSFRLLEGYNPDLDLIIDPDLIFSTYSGSTTDNWGFTACNDQLGNVYSGGIAFNVGYPVTLGAYQIDFESNDTTNPVLDCDITISKYSPDGQTLLWATYLGGAMGEEMPHSLVVNEFNELLIFGTTGSADYPVSDNAYCQTFKGGENVTYDGQVHFREGTDIMVSKLSADGTQLTASTFVGGNQNDGLNWQSHYTQYTVVGNDSLYYNYGDGARGEIICDLNNNVYIGSTTFSDDFPIINGFQSTSNGLQEGIVFKLSADLSQLEWSSYIGGNQDDAVYSLEINSSNEVYVAGGTVSNNFPTTSSAYQSNFQGGSADGFASRISADGSNLLASTYFGSSAYDQVFFVRKNESDQIFITGQTRDTLNTFIYNADYNHPQSGQFITKLTANLDSIEWSTTFGTGNGEPNISISAFAVDICNKIYLSGWGRVWGSNNPSDNNYWLNNYGTHNMDITEDAVQSETDGQDFYIMVMEGDASALSYATFFGELHSGSGYCGHDHVDGGTSRFDPLGNIYQSVCASCGFVSSNISCNDFPTTTGAAYEDNGGIANSAWVCNNAVFCFSLSTDLTLANFYTPTVVCENTPIHFENTGSGSYFYWDFGDASPISNEVEPTHNYISPGTYEVSLIATDTTTCNISDTIKKTITVQAQTSSFTLIKQDILCYGTCSGSILINCQGLYPFNIEWLGDTDSLDNTNYLDSLCEGTYYAVVSDSIGCTDSLEIQIVEPEKLIAQEDSLSNTGCGVLSETGYLSLEVTGGTVPYSYIWSNGSETPYVDNLSVGNYYVIVRDQNNCSDTISFEISDPSNLNIAVYNTTIFCQDSCDATALVNIITPSTPEYSYLWSTGDTTQQISDLCVGNYFVTVTDSEGCKRTKFFMVGSVSFLDAVLHYDHPPCFGDSVSASIMGVGGTGPYTYQWSSGGNDAIEPNLVAGTYSVTVTDAHHCVHQRLFTIQEPSEIQIDSTITGVNCIEACNGTAEIEVFGGTPPYQYLWEDGTTAYPADALCYGMHSILVSDSHQCTKLVDFFVPVNPVDSVGFSVTAEAFPSVIYEGENAQLFGFVDGSYSYVWTPPQTLSQSDIANPIASPLQTTIYKLNVTDAYGCTYSDTTIVRVKDVLCSEPKIFIPNAFSPNGDGYNDVLYVRGETIESLQLSIYNRWGELVFETHQINQGWDGTYQGKPATPAVFVYYLKVTCVNQETFEKQGNITLIR